jgi:ABC-2 type transport system permease protein
MMRLLLHELRAQQLLFWRNREAAFFSFLFPIILLVLLGSVYGNEDIEGVRGSTYLLAGLIGYGVAATAFASLAITLVVRREAGLLKRVRGTPLSPLTYLAAVIGSMVTVIALQAAAQVLIGRFVLDAAWPASPGSFVVVLMMGAAAFAALGLAVTTFVRTGEGSSPVVNAIYLPMAFISGAFFSPRELPRFLEVVSEALPLTYLLRLIRSTFIEGELLTSSPGAIAAVLVWGFVGLVVASRMFRWEPREGMTGA